MHAHSKKSDHSPIYHTHAFCWRGYFWLRVARVAASFPLSSIGGSATTDFLFLFISNTVLFHVFVYTNYLAGKVEQRKIESVVSTNKCMTIFRPSGNTSTSKRLIDFAYLAMSVSHDESSASASQRRIVCNFGCRVR